MRKFFVALLILIFVQPVFAQSQYAAIISKMEKSILGIEYASQNDLQRLSRLEKNIYGQTFSGTLQERLNKLSKDVNADVMGQEIKPKRDTFADESDYVKEDIPKEDKSVNYPRVNALEDNVFHKEFKGIDVTQRLSNLEQKVFGKTYDDDLNNRVDRLQSATGVQQKVASDDSDTDFSNYYSDDNNDYDSDRSGGNDLSDDNQQSLKDNNKTFYTSPSENLSGDGHENGTFSHVKLASIEKNVLNQTYNNDNLYNRLARLETALFGTIFNQEDASTRIERISSAYKASKSSKKYDGNKLSQHLGTAMQIGAILLMVLAFVF